jgi:putative phosphoesterase
VQARPTLVGVVSDTHGLVRPEAVAALADCDLIVHAGDVGGAEVLERLRAIAPVVAVRGNNDKGEWADALRDTEVVEVGGVSLYVLHEISALDLDPEAVGFAVVVSGHSHRASAEVRAGVLYLNPGSIGPRRFSLPVTLARLAVTGAQVAHEIVELRV